MDLVTKKTNFGGTLPWVFHIPKHDVHVLTLVLHFRGVILFLSQVTISAPLEAAARLYHLGHWRLMSHSHQMIRGVYQQKMQFILLKIRYVYTVYIYKYCTCHICYIKNGTIYCGFPKNAENQWVCPKLGIYPSVCLFSGPSTKHQPSMRLVHYFRLRNNLFNNMEKKTIVRMNTNQTNPKSKPNDFAQLDWAWVSPLHGNMGSAASATQPHVSVAWVTCEVASQVKHAPALQSWIIFL